MVFRNPNVKAGVTEPFVKMRDEYVLRLVLLWLLWRVFAYADSDNSGMEDMRIEDVWVNRGVKAVRPQDYHL